MTEKSNEKSCTNLQCTFFCVYEKRAYGFGTTWRWKHHFWLANPLKLIILMIMTPLQNNLWDSNATTWNSGYLPMESIHLFLWSSSMCVIMVRMCCCRRTVENCGHSILDTHLNPELVIRPVIGGFIMSSAWSWKAAPRALRELFVLWPDDTQCLELTQNRTTFQLSCFSPAVCCCETTQRLRSKTKAHCLHRQLPSKAAFYSKWNIIKSNLVS